MMDEETDIGLDVSGAVTGLTRQMRALDAVTSQFGRSLSRALAGGITQGKGFDDVLKNIGQRFLEIALKSAVKPLENSLGSMFSSLFSGFGGLGGLGGGGGPTTFFAEGGVINTPHFFPMGRGLGVAGERGAEAILPLSRGPDGRLGVATGAGGNGPVRIVMNISTPDAESFRRSEAQVSASLARAVARGQRSL
ncbi:MAG: phage tail tape measure protein [Hyphomicrobiales bacterium]|jgi:phage-related minor tail protein|nr:phage tail tape measure protein [Hyphomicrobiales bacterium]